jgi:SNF2 family DNA or RNA helicase
LIEKNQKDTDEFYNQKVTQAKAIMEPFIFRRLKIDVLKDLPEKNQETVFCEMTPYQKTEYNRRLDFFKTRKMENLAIKENGSGKENSKKEDCIFGVWTELRYELTFSFRDA